MGSIARAKLDLCLLQVAADGLLAESKGLRHLMAPRLTAGIVVHGNIRIARSGGRDQTLSSSRGPQFSEFNVIADRRRPC